MKVVHRPVPCPDGKLVRVRKRVGQIRLGESCRLWNILGSYQQGRKGR